MPQPSRMMRITGRGTRAVSRCKSNRQVVSRLWIDKGGSRLLDRRMKWRNQLLALFCLLVFAAFGVFYFQHWVVQKPFGVILFIGEGLAPGRIAPTRIYTGGVDKPLTLDSMPHVALVRNYSNDFAAPEPAAP